MHALLRRIHPGNRDKCSYGKLFSSVAEIPVNVGTTEILVTGPARPIIWKHQTFYKGSEVKQDLGNRASQINRAHMKRPSNADLWRATVLNQKRPVA